MVKPPIPEPPAIPPCCLLAILLSYCPYAVAVSIPIAVTETPVLLE
jgi:hypothetical protein